MSKRTYCNVQYTTFIWRVKYPNFSLGCDIRSPNFSVDSFGNTKFYVSLFSEKESELYNYISVHLAKHETYCGPSSIAFDVKLYLADDGTDELFVEGAISFVHQQTVLLQRCVPVKRRKKCCFHGFFSVRLEIEPSNVDLREDLFCCNLKELEMLSSDLNRALKTKRFCDFAFRSIGGRRSVSLHKCILAARYPNLVTYLGIDENAKIECNINTDWDAIDMLTQYLYSGSIDTAGALFELHDILKMAPLDHLEQVLYPTPRIIHASTSVTSKYGSFVWIIPKFSSLEEGRTLVNSLRLDSNLEWTKIRILFYISKNAVQNRCLAFKIERSELNDKMYMLCTISFVEDKHGEYSKTFEHVFRIEKNWNITCFTEMNAILSNRDMLLPDDTLKLRLEFIISDLIESLQYECIRCLEVKEGNFSALPMNLWALQMDLKSLYLEPAYCDCTLQVREDIIPAHKVILSARSPVFSNYFDGSTPENETNRIVVDAYEPCVIKSMLCYIYCGELPNKSRSHITNLYRAAHKYQIKQLTDKCSRILGSFLAIYMVPDVLKIADENKDDYLKECVKNFVRLHPDQVFESAEWDALKRERIDLTASIMNAVLEPLK